MNAPFKPINEAATDFVRRHVGPSPRDVNAMLETVGAASLQALMNETLPASIRQKAPLDLGRALSETEALALFEFLTCETACALALGQSTGSTWTVTGRTRLSPVTLEVVDDWVEWMTARGLATGCDFHDCAIGLSRAPEVLVRDPGQTAC